MPVRDRLSRIGVIWKCIRDGAHRCSRSFLRRGYFHFSADEHRTLRSAPFLPTNRICPAWAPACEASAKKGIPQWRRPAKIVSDSCEHSTSSRTWAANSIIMHCNCNVLSEQTYHPDQYLQLNKKASITAGLATPPKRCRRSEFNKYSFFIWAYLQNQVARAY